MSNMYPEVVLETVFQYIPYKKNDRYGQEKKEIVEFLKDVYYDIHKDVKNKEFVTINDIANDYNYDAILSIVKHSLGARRATIFDELITLSDSKQVFSNMMNTSMNLLKKVCGDMVFNDIFTYEENQGLFPDQRVFNSFCRNYNANKDTDLFLLLSRINPKDLPLTRYLGIKSIMAFKKALENMGLLYDWFRCYGFDDPEYELWKRKA